MSTTATGGHYHEDLTEEVRERVKFKLWERRDISEEDETRLAVAIARNYGVNQSLLDGPVSRDYKAGKITAENVNWTGTHGSADAVQRAALPTLRARGRDGEENNPYAERYLTELEANVLGPEGMTLQMQVTQWDPDAPSEYPSGKKKKGAMVIDEQANDIVETAWHRWKGLGVCDVSGELSFHEIERLVLRSCARDGDCLIRMVRGWDNGFDFALQLIEGDALDHNFNGVLPNGNIVVMGVEMDEWKRRVAYHILTKHPGDFFVPSGNPMQRRERIDAREIIHLRFLRRIGQTRGVSWFAPVLGQMEMLNGYEEAEVTSARAEACKGGFFYSDLIPEGGFAGAPPDPTTLVRRMGLTPGQMRSLPYGVKYQEVNPTHPNGNYGEFRKGVLRGISSGLSVSYNILANDLQGVNYSSLRGGLLDEREVFKMLQSWFIVRFEMIVFKAWLEQAILARAVPLNFTRFDKYNAPYFQGRRWDWVDPSKDIDAIEKAIALGLTSLRTENAKRGNYILDVAREQQGDKAIAERFGLDWFAPKAGAPAPAAPVAPAPPEDEDPEKPGEGEGDDPENDVEGEGGSGKSEGNES